MRKRFDSRWFALVGLVAFFITGFVWEGFMKYFYRFIGVYLITLLIFLLAEILFSKSGRRKRR